MLRSTAGLLVLTVLLAGWTPAVTSRHLLQGAAGAAEAGVAVAQGIIDIAKSVSEVVGEDKEARDKFSRMLVDDLTSQYPDYDAVAAVKGDIEGDAVHQHAELNYKLGLTSQGYEVYAVKHGDKAKFTREGDGGFINWAYSCKMCTRDDNVLTWA